ncbi:MAG: hypothetical protein ACRDL6_01315 [Solirubrobacterales bacterium]
MQGSGTREHRIQEIEAIRRRVARNPWGENERAAKQRIRDDAKRPLGVNLAEGLALSEFLLSFTGTLSYRG